MKTFWQKEMSSDPYSLYNQLYNSINTLSFTDFQFFLIYQSLLLQASCLWERDNETCSHTHTIWLHCHYINPFPHTTILQQTTLNIFCQKIENLYNWMDNLWLKVENIVSKGEIARFVQFLLLSLCFQKAVCCRGIRKRLYEGKI